MRRGAGKDRRLEAPAEQPFGRVDLEHVGNTVRVRTHGVRRFRLLQSTDVFDLDVGIVVEVNGHEVHRAVAPPSHACCSSAPPSTSTAAG